MTYEALLEHIITDGIAEVREAYANPKDHHKRDGAIEGFEACRGKTPAEIIELWRHASVAWPREESHEEGDLGLKNYWKLRYKELQIEFVLNVISVGLTNSGQAPLLSHLPTARAALKYAEIVGVNDEEVSA